MLHKILFVTRFPVVVFALFTLTVIFAVQVNSQSRNSLPDLSGDKAVDFLKGSGEYDSLMKAVKANAYDKGESPAENALGTMTKVIASDGAAEDYLGYSVSISGGFAVVGAPFDNEGVKNNVGSVYIFQHTGGSSWTLDSKLKPFDGSSDDNFGWSVDIDFDLIIVGAPNDDNTYTDQGSVYVYRANPGFGWFLENKLVASDSEGADKFGYSVAVSGSTFAIGAPFDDFGTFIDKGSVYVYVGATQQDKFSSTDVASGDRFGNTVGVSGGTLIAGSPGDDIGSKVDQGSAYIFKRTGADWAQAQKLTDTSGAQGDNFGAWVAINNELAVVGSPGDDVGGKNDQGSAFLYESWGLDGYTEKHQLFAPDGAAGDQFGRCVAVSGSNIIVGAYKSDIDGKNDQGAAYRFTYLGDGAPIGLIQKLTSSDGATGDNFGFSVAVEGNTVIFGSYLDDLGTDVNQGSAYIKQL